MRVQYTREKRGKGWGGRGGGQKTVDFRPVCRAGREGEGEEETHCNGEKLPPIFIHRAAI